MVTVDLLLEVDSGGDGQVHGALSRGDPRSNCHLSWGNRGAIWAVPHRIRQLFQSSSSKGIVLAKYLAGVRVEWVLIQRIRDMKGYGGSPGLLV